MSCKLYVVGHPVAHSKSPVMHNAAYRALGLDWDYGFADCPDAASARRFFEQDDWLALNVTMPYKPAALEAATEASDAARLAQGANVLVRRGGELLADNTDGVGCMAYLERNNVKVPDARVVVCGTGPTSLSIMHAAACAGASRVVLLGRDEARSHAALEGYLQRMRECVSSSVQHADMRAGSYAQSADEIEAADIIVDATPLGMNRGDPAPFDVALLSAGSVVLDVVYGHGETALLAAARAARCVALDGSGMLVGQAVETVRDIVEWLDLPIDLASHDLYAIMHSAAFRQ